MGKRSQKKRKERKQKERIRQQNKKNKQQELNLDNNNMRIPKRKIGFDSFKVCRYSKCNVYNKGYFCNLDHFNLYIEEIKNLKVEVKVVKTDSQKTDHQKFLEGIKRNSNKVPTFAEIMEAEKADNNKSIDELISNTFPLVPNNIIILPPSSLSKESQLQLYTDYPFVTLESSLKEEDRIIRKVDFIYYSSTLNKVGISYAGQIRTIPEEFVYDTEIRHSDPDLKSNYKWLNKYKIINLVV